MEKFLNARDDCRWVRETHLKGLTLPRFASFVIFGNEDCPTKIELYRKVSPSIHDKPVMTWEEQRS